MADRPLCVLIGALGGQGGGVLTDWLVQAARVAGFLSQATSIPGVAQRTGATTYYFELFPVREPAADPVFCPHPSAGDVDLVAALEPTEAARALAGGYVTRQTAVVTSTARIYSTAEKSVAGDGIAPLPPLLAALAQVGQRLITVEPGLAPGAPVNAQIFGAIIGSGVLPIPVAAAQAAIEERGLAVTVNMAAFAAGLGAAQEQPAIERPAQERPAAEQVAQQPATLSNGRQLTLPGLRYDAPPPAFAAEVAAFPVGLRPLLGHALGRLLDYQDAAYARRYLARLERVLVADGQAGGAEQGFHLTSQVARPLAAWMSYEDVARVAQLKTRPGRLARIRAEMGAAPAEPVTITDFLTPGLDQVANLLPARLARLLAPGQEVNGQRANGVPVAWPTSSPLGYGLLKLLAGLRRLRPYSHTFIEEQTVIDNWIDATIEAAAVDYDLACQVASLAVWARGYGRIRARGRQRLQTLFSGWSERLQRQPEAIKADVAALLLAARDDPDGVCGRQA
jgi:indolepyruvate ferredoxin oxidoreductase, beta subunit